MKKVLLFPLLSFLVLPALLSAVEVKAVRVKEAPHIDGLLSDPVWQSAIPISGFRMVEPHPDQDPTEKTEAMILFDDANLYIGVFCRDSDPRRISATTMAHDSGGSQEGMGFGHAPQALPDDTVRVLLDPFQDKRTAYIFFVNSRGARGEGLAYDGSSSLNWDGIWEAKSRILENGWSTEFRIPFKTISFKPGLSVWGLNIERTIARKQETIRLSGTTRDSNFNNPMEAASLAGIEGIKQGMGITFRPYGLASAQRIYQEPATSERTLDGGFDIYKSFTPNLVGAASYQHGLRRDRGR